MDPTLDQSNQVNTGVPTTPTPVSPVNGVAQPVSQDLASSVAPIATPSTDPTPPTQEPVGDVYIPPTGTDQMTGSEATDIFASVDPIDDNPEPTTPTLSEPKPINMGNMEPEVPAEEIDYGQDKPKRKLLKILIPLVIVVGALVGGGLFYMKSQKTSTAVLKSFGDATTEMVDRSKEINSGISKVAYSSASDELDDAVKNYDAAVAKFEDATSKLKSDRKALKGAAENYIAVFKDYRKNVIGLALEARRVAPVAFKMGVILGMAGTHSENNYDTYLNESLTSMKGYKEELTGLELTNETAKSYRDASLELADKMTEAFNKMKTAYAAGDQATVDSTKATFSTMLVGSSIAAKEKEIKNALSYGNEISTKLDAARKTLNDEIAKLNTN